MSPTIVCVEGNIGAGKTTLLSACQRLFRDDEFIMVPEPVEEWNQVVDSHGVGLLTARYKDPSKYGFTFQVMVLTTLLRELVGAVNTARENNIPYVVMERSVASSGFIFFEMMCREKDITDTYQIQVYWKLFQQVYSLPDPIFIYLQTSPSVCLKRIKQRNRPGEEVISLNFLKKLQDYHIEFYSTFLPDHYPHVYHLSCDGSQTPENLASDMMDILNRVEIGNTQKFADAAERRLTSK